MAGGVAASGLTVPVVLAETNKKYKAVYDDDVSPVKPLPGTTEPSTRAENGVTRVETRFGELLDVETISDKDNGVVVHVSKVLSSYVEVARQYLNTGVDETTRISGDLFERFIRDERGAAKTIASLKDEHEDVLPAAIYVLIAGLTGSILSRRRNILFRGLAPIIFGTGAFAYLLPRTFDNTRSLAWKLEKEQVPELAEKQIEAQKQVTDLQKKAQDIYDDGEKEVQKGWKSTRQTIKDWTGW